MRKFLRLTMPSPDAPALVRQLFAIMHRERVSIEILAERSGYGETTIHRWRDQSHGPCVRALADCLEVLGYELKIVRKRDPEEERTAA